MVAPNGGAEIKVLDNSVYKQSTSTANINKLANQIRISGNRSTKC